MNFLLDFLLVLHGLFAVALTNGREITFDVDYRPELRRMGFFTFNKHGMWQTSCTDDTGTQHQATTAAHICDYLGFSDYQTYYLIDLHKMLRSNNFMSSKDEKLRSPNTTCFAAYVTCADNVSHKLLKFNRSDEIQEDIFNAPWKATIYVDGKYKCSGTMFRLRWVLVPLKCFKNPLE